MKAKNEGHALTNAGEDYLEAIYCLILEHPGDDSSLGPRSNDSTSPRRA